MSCIFIQVNLVASNEPFEVVWFKGGENVSESRDARVWVNAFIIQMKVYFLSNLAIRCENK